MPAFAALAVGVFLGYATGGSLSRLGALELRLGMSLPILFLVQAFARGRMPGVFVGSRWALAVWVVSSALLVLVLIQNPRVPGLILAAVGVLMNLDVVLINLGMPLVVGGKLGWMAPISAAQLVAQSGHFYRVAGGGDLAIWLGDVIPLTTGRGLLLVSPGDVILLVGAVVAVVHGMTLDTSRIGASSDRIS